MNYSQWFLVSWLFPALIISNAWAVSCGDLITADVTLTADLHCTSGYYGLEVAADNVSINLNGYQLSGTSSLAGIVVIDHNRVTIKGPGFITGFWAGINTADTTKLKVADISFSALGEGIVLSSANNAQINDNSFINLTSRGVAITNNVAGSSADNNEVQANEFHNTRIGIEICGKDADANRLLDNLIYQSSDYGIHVIASRDNELSGNRILESGITALRMSDSSYNVITSNSLRMGRVGFGLYADASGACLAGASAVSGYNSFKYNHSIGFDTGIVLGLGGTSSYRVLKNHLNHNKLYDNDTGIFFNTDTYANNAKSNAYTGTLTPVVDTGTSNQY